VLFFVPTPGSVRNTAHALHASKDRTVEPEDITVRGNKLFMLCSLGDKRKSNRNKPFSLQSKPTLASSSMV
jgi:hypothetical protein